MALKRNVVQWDDALSRVEPRAFEQLIAEYYLRRGFHVEHAGAQAREQQRHDGVDLRLRRGDDRVVVQCKHWRVCQIMPGEVRELQQVMRAESATGAVMITTGEFTDAALRAARSVPIQLIDGREIREMLDRVSVQQAERTVSPTPAVLRPLPGARVPARGATKARPFIVPAMVLVGCLIATIGLSRSMTLARHGHPAMPASPPAPTHAGDDATRAAVASIEGVADARWSNDRRLVVTAKASADVRALAGDACAVIGRAGVAAGVVVLVEEPVAGAVPAAFEHACEPAVRAVMGTSVTMAGTERSAYP